MKNKKTIIMTDPVLCCDLYPYGSLQRVTEREDGFLGVDGRNDVIPDKFKWDLVPDLIVQFLETKNCEKCSNEFCLNMQFEFHEDSDTIMCPRCYERHTKIDR